MQTGTILSQLTALSQFQPLLLAGTILAASFLEVIFPPIPGIMVLIAAGAAARPAGIHPLWLIITAAAGSFAASYLVYSLGFRLQMQALAIPKYARLLETRSFSRIEGWYQRYGYTVLILSRFLPFARPGFALAAGILRLGRHRALAALAISILLSSTVFVYTGYLLGLYSRVVTRGDFFYHVWSSKIQLTALLIICGLLFPAFCYWIYRRIKR